MAVVYRPHRHIITDAMKELQVFESEKQMLEELSKDPYVFNLHVDKNESMNDDRIGWTKTYFIIGDYHNQEIVYGMCDTETFKDMSVEEARESTLNTYKKRM